jgi:acyl carrier protein
LDKEAIFIKIKEIMIAEFEFDEGLLLPDANLADDLDLDSMDMVDLILSLNKYIGDKVEPGLFKNARVVQDLVNLVVPYWKSIP